jgi:hypothetical protein
MSTNFELSLARLDGDAAAAMGRWILSLAGGISLRRLGEKDAIKSGGFSLYPAGLGMSSLSGAALSGVLRAGE